MIDVQDSAFNQILNAAFLAILMLALVALVPWRWLGYGRASHALRWLFVPVVALAILYERAMPSRFDIRVDLLMLVPAYAVVLVTSLARWLSWTSARRSKSRN